MLLVGHSLFQAQTVYSENMGTPSATTLITAYTGWQNAASIVYTGSGDVRTSLASSGYTGASGSGNVFLTNIVNRDLIISGINTSAYASAGLTLSFGYLTNSTAIQLVVEQSVDNGTTWTPITFTNNTNTGWNLVTIAGQLASNSSLSLRFKQPTTAQMRIDDIKIVNISTTCALVPGAPSTACDASTLAIDNYTITIPFTGGGTASYTVTATTGTVGGDNPSTVASGNIIVTGTQEGVANSISITGGTCNFSIAVSAPINGCKPINTLPANEPFNYTVGQALGAQQKWSTLNSGDNILVSSGNLSYPGITSTGNSITFDGSGSEGFIPFTNTTSNAVYASFIFSATSLANVTTDLANTYFAVLTDQAGAFTTARLWIRKSGTQYQFGLGAGTAPTVWSPNLYNENSVQYLTFGYDFASNQVVLFENQVTPTTQTISVVATAPITAIGGLILRQDGATNTPFIQMDELTINNTVILLGIDEITSIKSNFVKNTFVENEINFGAKADVKIFSMNGQLVKSANVSENKSLEVSELEAGMYIVTGTVKGEAVSQKIIKK